MIFVLNTCLNQLTGKVNCDWVWNSHSRNKSKYFNGQVGLNQLAGSKDCDEIEYWYNLNELGLSISMTKLFKNQIIPSSTITWI